MFDASATPAFLLGCFAAFYEEIADIKLAAAQGSLSAYLTGGDDTPPTLDIDFAARVSARLELFLLQQEKDVRRTSNVAEIEMYRKAQYAMAALADDIFILDLDWPGQSAWLGVLLEYKLFHSRNAGTRFFEIADLLLHAHSRNALDRDVASVFLLALQLGFKGSLRGVENTAALHAYRQQLYRLAEAGQAGLDLEPAFPQAYQHTLGGGKDERMAPLSPWCWGAGIALAAYLLASTIVWMTALHPFEQVFGG